MGKWRGFWDLYWIVERLIYYPGGLRWIKRIEVLVNGRSGKHWIHVYAD